ncbi:MAG: hypothetical protein D3905_15585 [Candidatus Electrothrix sp. AS4_5]|nr:hypothetical protein [Candidatus Electrothrix gigas]MCI5191173.1 hypothetical protein [Candidatus Electrothrix gigas]
MNADSKIHRVKNCSKKIRAGIFFLQVLCMLGAVPFLMGQQSCQVQESLLQTLDTLANRFQPQTPGNFIYVAQLSFIDGKSKKILQNTKEVRLINQAVVQGIRQAELANPYLKFNQTGHIIHDTEENIRYLTSNFYNSNRTPEENLNAVVQGVMAPAEVDVIVTGQYIDNDTSVVLAPLLISRQDKKQISKRLVFNKHDYICGQQLCTNAHEEIAKAVKSLLDSL